jgi:hypothetical protein
VKVFRSEFSRPGRRGDRGRRAPAEEFKEVISGEHARLACWFLRLAETNCICFPFLACANANHSNCQALPNPTLWPDNSAERALPGFLHRRSSLKLRRGDHTHHREANQKLDATSRLRVLHGENVRNQKSEVQTSNIEHRTLADAYLVRLSELHSDCRVLTLDSHFTRYRRHGRQVIPLLIP